MSYDLHITRKEYWASEEGTPIAAEEWLAFVDNDPEFQIEDAANEPYFAVWNGTGDYECWIDYDAEVGGLFSKEPTDEFFVKMVQIAEALGAKVQSDEGEIYTVDS